MWEHGGTQNQRMPQYNKRPMGRALSWLSGNGHAMVAGENRMEFNFKMENIGFWAYVKFVCHVKHFDQTEVCSQFPVPYSLFLPYLVLLY
jgi:hypothetical protein